MRKTSVLLFLIIVLAASLRLFMLTFNPPSLNWDEVSHGYNAYSILKTGRDEWGRLFPISNFRAYGDYPLPLNLYLTIPFIATLGLNEFTIRLPHAILGILTVIATYFLASGITKKRKISLLAALLVAIEPWYVFTSRFVLQSNLSVFFLTAGMAVFVNREKHRLLLPLSLIFLGLTLFSYHSTRILTPILLVVVVAIYFKEFIAKYKKDRFVSVVSASIAILFFLPLPFILFNPEARARSNVVFLLDQGAINKIIEARNDSPLPKPLTNLIYNRPVYFVEGFFKNYLEYFSPDFLFLKGGTQYQFSVPNSGLLFLINLPFFYLGLILLVKGALHKNKEYMLILTWLLLSPIPASITNESFAVVRATTMLPIPQVLTALGLFCILSWLSNKKLEIGNWKLEITFRSLMIIYMLILFLFLENYLVSYFTDYREKYSWSWQYGYKEAVNYAKEHYGDYDKIIVTKKYGEPQEFFLFFWPWDPQKYRDDPNLIRFYQSNWYWVDHFDNFYFINDWNISKAKKDNDWDTFQLEYKDRGSSVFTQCGYIQNIPKNIPDNISVRFGGKCLLVTSPGNVPDDKWEKLKTINFLDGKPAFEIYEIKPISFTEYLRQEYGIVK